MNLVGSTYINGKRIPVTIDGDFCKLYFEEIKTENDEMKPESTFKVAKLGSLSGWHLVRLSLPVDLNVRFPHTATNRMDWVIEGWDERAYYTEMTFSFSELDYFCPSSNSADMPITSRAATFDFDKVNEIFSCDFLIHGKNVKFRVITKNEVAWNIAKVTAKTRTFLKLDFESTQDMDFISDLYHCINNLFVFLCNRKNISLDNVVLSGIASLPFKSGPKMQVIRSYMTFFNKYKEPDEDEKVIGKTIAIGYVKSHLAELVQLTADSFDDKPTIPVERVHSSTHYRNLIDLRQTLNISSSFEYLQRNFCPEAISEESKQIYEEIIELIQKEYVDNQHGKKKKVGKDVVKFLKPSISLGDLLKKTIKGYGDWKSLENIITPEYTDYDPLAHEENLWRNEQAHNKNDFVVTGNTIRAVRMTEHVNYCIVLRHCGYSNDEIRAIIKEVLVD